MSSPISRRVFDIVIVGGGMAGATAAYHLSRSSSSSPPRILMVEAFPSLCSQSSGKSAALLQLCYGAPILRKMAFETRENFSFPPLDFRLDEMNSNKKNGGQWGDNPLMSPRTTLMFGNKEQESKLYEFQKNNSTYCNLKILTPKQLRSFCPILRPEASDGGACIDETSQDLDVNAIFFGYMRGAKHYGRLEYQTNCDLVAAEPLKGGIGWKVFLGKGAHQSPHFSSGEGFSSSSSPPPSSSLTVECGMIINASGAWIDQVNQKCATPALGVRPMRRTAFVFSAPEKIKNNNNNNDDSLFDSLSMPTICSIEEDWYVNSYGPGRILGSPAEEIPSPPCEAFPDLEETGAGVERIERDTFFKIDRLHAHWAGLRVFAPEGEKGEQDDSSRLPIIGFDPLSPSPLMIVGCLGGNGIQTSFGVGDRVGKLFAGKEIERELNVRRKK